MRLTRIYCDSALEEGGSLRLEGAQGHYLSRVLRLETGAEFVVFNGTGGEYRARVERTGADAVEARVGAFVNADRDSPLKITLVQALSRGERMDFTMQKAVELGVHVIAPVATERSVVRLDGERRARRIEHWRSITVNACQQCGRTRLPRVEEIVSLDQWLESNPQPQKSGFVLSPAATLTADEIEPRDQLAVLIGAEGGFSEGEMERITRAGIEPLSLGPRILRTETAAVAALTALQLKCGDLSRRL